MNNTYSVLTYSPQVYVDVKGLHNNVAFCFKCYGFWETLPVRGIKIYLEVQIYQENLVI